MEEQHRSKSEGLYRNILAALGVVVAAGAIYALFFPFCTENRVLGWVRHQIPFGKSISLPPASWMVKGCEAGRTEGSLWSAEGDIGSNPQMHARLTMYPNVSAPDTQAMDMVAMSLSPNGEDRNPQPTSIRGQTEGNSQMMEISASSGSVSGATFLHPDHSAYIYPISEPRLSDLRWSSINGASLMAAITHVLDRRRILVYLTCPESPSKEAAVRAIKQTISRCSPVWNKVFENSNANVLPAGDDCSSVFDHIALTPAWQPPPQ
jgi:hypothetical protein